MKPLVTRAVSATETTRSLIALGHRMCERSRQAAIQLFEPGVEVRAWGAECGDAEVGDGQRAIVDF
ncbi:hypothetical protein CEQ30_19820 [Nocardia brasiliensis]|nr:hypothetical protein CEQ30_19820 [Nocardia brasiliensis]